MARIYRRVFELCWGLGYLTLLLAVVLKLVPTWAENLTVSPRGGLILAGVLFLGALATREMERAAPPAS